MIDWTQALTPIGSGFALMVVVGTIVGSVFYGRSKVKEAIISGAAATKDTAIADMKTSVDALRDQNTLQATQLTELRTNVAKLESAVNTLSKVPLGKIELHIAESNINQAITNRILEALLPLIPNTIEKTTTSKTVTTNAT